MYTESLKTFLSFNTYVHWCIGDGFIFNYIAALPEALSDLNFDPRYVSQMVVRLKQLAIVVADAYVLLQQPYIFDYTGHDKSRHFVVFTIVVDVQHWHFFVFLFPTVVDVGFFPGTSQKQNCWTPTKQNGTGCGWNIFWRRICSNGICGARHLRCTPIFHRGASCARTEKSKSRLLDVGAFWRVVDCLVFVHAICLQERPGVGAEGGGDDHGKIHVYTLITYV